MHPPKFWYQKKRPFYAYPLHAIGKLIRYFGQRRFKDKPGYQGPVPIICVGNATVGGTGKTPTALLLREIALQHFENPYFMTSGYGGSEQGPILVNDGDDPAQVGDEALLLAARGSVVLSKDRVAGAAFAEAQGADIIITDDGLQNHPCLHQNAAVLTVDRMRGFGNELLLPGGPLREPVDSALSKVTAVLLIGDPGLPVPKALEDLDIPVIPAVREVLLHGAALQNERVIALSLIHI